MEKVILGSLIFVSILVMFWIGTVLEKKKLQAKKKSEVVKIEPTF